jgi:hypothetical protein
MWWRPHINKERNWLMELELDISRTQSLAPSACQPEVRPNPSQETFFMKINGACHCGQVNFTAEIDPDKVMICNCADCQVLSGSVFRTIALASADTFKITGETRSYVKTADSGSARAQVFCPTCATPLYSAAPENATHVVLRLGCVAQRDQLKPALQLWQRSAASWLPELGRVPGVPTQLAPAPASPGPAMAPRSDA